MAFEFDANSAKLDDGTFDPNTAKPEKTSAARRLGDVGISVAKGIIGVPESAVGLADIVTGGRAGKAAESAGFQPKRAKEILSEFYSPQQKAANAAVEQADGFVPTLGAMVQNPSTIVNTVAESVPSMLGGGAIGRGIMKVAPAVSGVGAAAIGEGVVGAGQSAESIRQQTGDGLLTGQQAAIAGGVGALTGGISFGAGRLANKLGIGDIDTQIATGKLGSGVATNKGIIRKTAEGVLSEGALEEMPQSAQEQIGQNIALDKPYNEGVGTAMAQGLLSGGLMGAGGAAVGHLGEKQTPLPEPAPEPTGEIPAPLGLGLNPRAGTHTVFPDGSVILNSDQPAGEQAVFDKRFAPQPTKASEAMGIDPAAGPLSKAAATAVDTGAHIGTLAQSAQVDATNNISNEATNTPATPDIVNQNNAGAQTFGTAYAQRQASAPAIQSTDILNAEGKPFLTGFSAKKAANDAGDGYRPFKVGEKQFVVRYFEPENATKTIATQASSTPATVEKLPVLDQTTTALPQPKETNGTQTTEAVQAAQERPQAPIAEPLNVSPRTSDAGGVDSAVTVPTGNRNLADSGWKMLPQRGKADLPTSPAAVPSAPEAAPKADLVDLIPAKDTAESLAAQPATNTIATQASNTPTAAINEAKNSTTKTAGVSFKKDDTVRLIGSNGKVETVDSVGNDGWVYTKSGGAYKPGQVEAAHKPKPVASTGSVHSSSQNDPIAEFVAGHTGLFVKNNNIPIAQRKMRDDAPASKRAEYEAIVKAASQLAPQIAEAAHEAATSPKNDLPEPTQAQKEAGNYKKGHTTLHGLDISIENPVGSTRSGTDAKGKKWSNTMRHHYGYFKGTVGMDKDHIDTFIGDKPESQKVFVVDQIDPATGKPDEHKVMLGFETLEDAQKAYQANYAKGWKGAKATTETTIDEFKKWLKEGNTKKPFAVPAGLAKMQAAKAKKEAGKADAINRAREVYKQYRPDDEQATNPERFHKVTEDDNPKGLKIGDRILVKGQPKRGTAGEAWPDIVSVVTSIEGNAPPAYEGGYMVKSLGGWTGIDWVEKTDLPMPPSPTKPNAQPVQSTTKGSSVKKAEPSEPQPTVTPPEIRAEQMRQQKIKVERASRLKAITYKKSPFLAFLGKHGIILSERSEFSPDKNPFLSGYGPMFRRNGLPIDLLVARAVEDGFLPQGTEDDSSLRELITRQIRGDSIAPLYTEDGATDAMQQLMDERNQMPDEEELALDAAKLLQQESDEEMLALIAESSLLSENYPDPLDVLAELGFTAKDIEDTYNEYTKYNFNQDDEISGSAGGVATGETQRTGESTPSADQTSQAKEGLTAPRLTDKDALNADSFSGNYGDLITEESAGSWVLVRTSEDYYNTYISLGGGKYTGTSFANNSKDAYGYLVGLWVDRYDQKEKDLRQLDKSFFQKANTGAQPSLLTAPTRADVVAQQDRAENAEALDTKAQIDREAPLQTLTKQSAPDQRTDNTGDMFGLEKAQAELGKKNAGKQAESDPNQGSIFDAPAEAPKSDALNEKEKAAKAKMLNALGKLATLASKNTRMNWTPEEEQKLLPIVIELFDGAMELGAVTFQKAVKYVRDYIAQGIDQETADAIPFDTLQGAYIATSGRHKDKGVTPKKEVASFESLAELEAETKPLLTDTFYDSIRLGNMPKDNPALRKMVETFDGKPADNARLKEAQEELEAAIARTTRDVISKNLSQRDTFDELLRLYNSQPLLNIRTSTSIANQAYSTPAPLAYLASELAGITKDDTVLEPTGGTGMLIAGANPGKTLANELNDHRAELLRAQGFTVTQDDAANGFKGTFDKVNTNPPFGSIKDDKGNVIKVPVDGYRLGQIDHLIAARALAAMKDDGKATLILGANKVAGGISNDDLIFFNWLYGHYNVTGHFEVEGDLYARQGAGWPVRVISINGRQKSNKTSPIAGAIKRADNWSQVYEYFNDSLATSRTESNPSATTSAGGASASETTAKPVPANTSKPPASANQRRPAGSAGDNGNVAGTTTRTVPDSAESAGNPMGASADTKRLNAAASESDRLDAGGDTMGRRADKPANTTGTTALSSGENQFQAKYVPRSSRKDEGVLIPVNMKDPTQDALSKLEDAVGNIDDYAVKELGYANTEELHDALMGLQVDSVASAIYQIKQGNGIVIADQTGIGKGRQAAAIIRWAEKQGHIPIFVTVKPSLFTDMYGDLADIGTNDINPFIMNGSEWISGANGERLFANKPLTHKNKLNTIAATGELPTGSNALFMTYSQINVDNVQRKALTALTDKAVFILDESHNAGGASATGEFITSVLGAAKGVTYLSATYAKRPDNMPLYFKTDIGKASADNEGLMNAMAAGGLPLQTVVSNNLVKAGQMFRRERSFDGIVFETKIDSKNKAVHEALSDKVTAALRSIVAADAMFHEVYVKELSKQLAKEGSRAIDNAGNQAQDSVQHTEFSSVVHNFVRQMLLGLKAQSAADDAIAALKRGEKPIIAVENTMGSFLNEYAAANSVIQGGSLGSFDYRTVLSRALARTRVMTEQKANGEKVKKTIPLSSLDGMTQAAYAQAQDVIDGLDLDIPVSPIDWMRYQIQKAGYSVSEITGRALSVDYSTPLKPTLSAISAQEQNDKVQTTRLFNSGKLDALILNVAGSTGISLHASEKFADKRQRHMIVAQPAQDINIFMQMLGRPHRTGQVIVPKYSLLGVDLPTEKRPTALLSKKMKSLNANTSSNTESATSVNTADMLNKYGDQIVGQYLHDNYHLAQALGIEAVTEDGDAVEDIARKATGRLALQPISVQNAFYSEVEGQYNALLEYLNKTNQNDLEPRTFDFDAKELRQEILFEGADKNSPFGEDAIYGEYSIKAQGLPMKPDEINAEIQENLGGKTSEVHILELSGALSKQFENFYKTLPEGVQQETAKKVLAEGTRFLQDHRIGKTFRVDINGDTFNAVVTNIRSTHKNAGNPLSLSKVQVSIAVNGALRHISVPATQFQKIEVSTIGQGYTIEQLFKEQPTDQRETAKIVTGNLLAAYGEIDGARGTIISFTKTDGTTEQGILLPKTFDFTKNTRGDYRLPTGAMALKFLQESDNNDIGRFGIMSRDSVVRVLPNGKGIAVQVPKSKLKGGKYFLDKGLIGVLGDFVTAGSYMKAKTDKPSDAIIALDLLMKKQALYALPSMAEEAKAITEKPAFSRAQTETPAFREDIPNESWLKSKVDYATSSPRSKFGVPKMGSITGYFSSPVMFPARWASELKGENGEQNNVRQSDLSAIRKIIKDTGKMPLNENGTEYVPYIEIGYDGKPWISEGNHRIMAALAEGMEYIPAEVRYFDGGQRNAGKWSPDNLLDIAKRNANPDIRYSQGKKSDVLSKDGKFKGWPKFNEWTRAEYNDVVNLLPKEYRDDSHRREPIAAEDWDVLAATVIPKLQEINQGKASFSLDKIGNILVNAQDVDISTILGKAKDIADQHDIGIYVTGNLKHHIAQLQQAGFESELGLAAVLQRAANTVYAPMPKPNIVRDGVGAIMSYKPRGFSQVLFTRFQQEQKVSGLPASKVQSIVDTLKSKWAAAPDIVVASTMDDAAIPQKVRDYNDTQLSQGATGAPEGFFYGGKVYLIADQLPTAKDVHRVLFHETLGHVGLRGAFGESLTPILKQISVMRKAEVTAKAIEYGLVRTDKDGNPVVDVKTASYAEVWAAMDDSHKQTAAEEVLAVMAQTKPELGFVKRAISAIRNWLRTHGIVNFGVSDDDIIANYILPARRFVEAGTKTKINETGLLNSLKAGNWYSELSRQVMASKTNAMPAGMWAGWIGSLTKKGVKPDEIEWSGVQDWLKMQTGKVTKDEVLSYLDQNGVQVEETVLGDMSPDETGETAKRAELAAMSDEELADEAESAGVGYDVYSPDASREGAIDDIIEAYMEGGAEAGEVTKAKYSQYTLPGGTNYREVLLTLPIKSESQSYYAVMEKQTKKYGSWMDAINNRTQEETNELRQAFEADNVSRESLKPYKSSHWDKPNVLAHIRLNDRVDADGSKVLFVEEIQSDWGQQAKKEGFAFNDADKARLAEVGKQLALARNSEYKYRVVQLNSARGVPEYWVAKGEGRNAVHIQSFASEQIADAKVYELNQDEAAPADTNALFQERDELENRKAMGRGVPTAPFVTATDKWLSLALKRVVKIAVDGGYDRVAFVNGTQSAERYALSSAVDTINWRKNGVSAGKIVTIETERGNIFTLFANGDGLVGRVDAKASGFENLKGQNLTEIVGKDFAKKILDEDGGDVSGKGLDIGGEGMKKFYDAIVPNTAKDVIRKLGGGAMEEATITLHKAGEKGSGDLRDTVSKQTSFTITETMKEKASGGMPLFARENAQQTESAAFKKWFGNSKVVDANGKPLVVYHGTGSNFDTFKTQEFARQGSYFAEHSEYANLFAESGSETGSPNVMPVYLSIKKPAEMREGVSASLYSSLKNAGYGQHGDLLTYDPTEYWGLFDGDSSLREALESLGFDGVKLAEPPVDGKAYPSWMVFNPAQIKSATGNNGNFDASNPDIRFSRTDDLLSAYTPEQIKEKQAQEAEALKRESETVKAPQKKVTADQVDLFNPQGALFSRATTANLKKAATDKLNEHFSAPGKLSWWHKSIGTMYNLAERSPEFKPVFDAAQGFINDVSYYATEAADMAPKILPKMENWRDLAKSPISATDNKAISAPIFEGTLTWTRDEAGKPVKLTELEARYANLTTEEKGKMLLKKRIVTEDQLKKWMASPLDIYDGAVRNRFESAFLKAGVVWSDAELKSIFNQTPEQISLYKEFRAATDKSLDNMAKAEMLRFGGDDIVGLKDAVMDAKDADEAGMLLRDYLLGLAEVDTGRKDALMESANGMVERADKVNKLKAEGYAPLSRFGKYSIDVVVDGERQYFGLHETIHEANKMAAKMRAEFGAANVSQGTLSEDQFKMFSGITPETLELFGNMLGFDSTGSEAQDKAFQTYLKLTKNNNSAMRRLIHRKGIMGFSEDAGRVLASFVYSNARNTSAALNMGNLGEAVNNIPKNQGELKDAAIGLAEYIKNPQEEAQAIRGLLFAQYLGGSIASAFVNLTQPFAVSFPWLSQFGGAAQSGSQLVKAMKDMANKSTVYEPDLVKALKHAEESGIVSPQEIHQLMAQARGAGTLRPGDGTKVGDAYAKAANTMSKLSLGWGKVFGMAEQLNRRSTFIAAYRIAKAQNMANPAAFAEKAVNETQFVYSKASKMRFGRGAVGGTLMTFKTYSIAYLELLHRMYTQGGPEGKKAVLLAMGVMMLMSGAGGLPFEDDILDLIDGALQKLGYNINSKKAKQQYLEDLFGQAGADFVERGISGLPGMPLDVSGRLGMGNLIPGTGLFKQKTDHTRDLTEIVGPIGDLAKRGVASAGKLFGGDLKGAGLEILPTALRNLEKGADMAMYDQYRDAKGYKVIETTPLEAALKFVGFQPATVARVQESSWITQQTKDFYNQRTADIRAKWAKGIAEKDPEQVKSAREEMASWNEKNPDQKMSANLPAIWKKVREMQKTKEQRLIDTAPKAMRMQLKRDLASA